MDNSIKAGESFKKQFEKLPIEEQEAIMKSVNANFTTLSSVAMRLSDDMHKALEPVRQAMRAIAQMPKLQLQLPKLELPNLELPSPNNGVAEPHCESIEEMPTDESLAQSVDTIAKILSEISIQSDARASEANSIALSANSISVQSLETARESNKISEKANGIAIGANTRSSVAMGVAVLCAIISLFPFLLKLFGW